MEVRHLETGIRGQPAELMGGVPVDPDPSPSVADLAEEQPQAGRREGADHLVGSVPQPSQYVHRIHDVVEDAERHGEVERVSLIQVLPPARSHLDEARELGCLLGGHGDHRLGRVDADDMDPVGCKGGEERATSAPDVEHPRCPNGDGDIDGKPQPVEQRAPSEDPGNRLTRSTRQNGSPAVGSTSGSHLPTRLHASLPYRLRMRENTLATLRRPTNCLATASERMELVLGSVAPKS